MRDKPCGCWGLHELLSKAKKFQTNILRIANAEEQRTYYLQLDVCHLVTEAKISPSPKRKYFKVHNALERLKPTFTYSELIAVLLDSGFSEATVKRYRVWLSDMHIIE